MKVQSRRTRRREKGRRRGDKVVVVCLPCIVSCLLPKREKGKERLENTTGKKA